MCQSPHPGFFQRLEEMDPEEVCRRSLAGYDSRGGEYLLPVLSARCRVDPGARLVSLVTGDGPAEAVWREPGVTTELALLAVMYLLYTGEVSPEGRWVNEYSLRGGAQFFRGPHAVPNRELARCFGTDTAAFERACRLLGGVPVEAGDAGFRFSVLPRVPAAVAFWYADEEFPASAKLLLDPTVQCHLPLDVVFALSVELYRRIMKAGSVN
ncbi:MAG: DUF3786 domain-containing protein [Spirochaetota bacterium]